MFQVLSLIFFLNCANVYAAESSTEEPISEEVVSALEAPTAPSTSVVSETNLDTEGQEVETLEQEYAINGFLLGLAIYNQNYNVDAKVLLDSTREVDVSSGSSDFQSAGVIGRYAILPIDKFGTDISASISSSVNHNNVGFSSITILKAEVNLGYAMLVGAHTPIYFLAGLGYEVVKGTDIEKILVPGGSSVQIGSGIGIGKKFNIEALYSYSIHSINPYFSETTINYAKQVGGATTVEFLPHNKVYSNIIHTRITYSY